MNREEGNKTAGFSDMERLLLLHQLATCGKIRAATSRELLLGNTELSVDLSGLPGSSDPDIRESAKENERRCRMLGVDVIPIGSPRYPPALRKIRNAPPIIFQKGELPLNRESVAVVGCRAPSDSSRRIARAISTSFAERGFCVVSGLAEGIDTEAHLSALNSGGVTVAVLGSDLGRIYPRSNLDLARRISEKGALLSEHADARPTPRNLIMRNRIISGIADFIVAVEPLSGADRAIRFAQDQGKAAFLIAKLGKAEVSRREDGVYCVDPEFSLLTREMVDCIIEKSREHARREKASQTLDFSSLQKVATLVNL